MIVDWCLADLVKGELYGTTIGVEKVHDYLVGESEDRSEAYFEAVAKGVVDWYGGRLHDIDFYDKSIMEGICTKWGRSPHEYCDKIFNRIYDRRPRLKRQSVT